MEKFLTSSPAKQETRSETSTPYSKFYNISDADRELYNLYKRMNVEELQSLTCPDNICNLVKFERFADIGDYDKFRGSINNILPILASFPDYTSALAFVESFKPGFRYSPYFKNFVESRIRKIEKENRTIYVLGDYKYVKYDDSEQWYYKGKLHREDGPADIEYYKDYKIEYQKWYLNGKLHREDGPAVINYYKNGQIEYEEWYHNDILQKQDGFYRDGKIYFVKWFLNGKLHREDGPAEIVYKKDGTIKSEKYYYRNLIHREDGPAEIVYKLDGTIKSEKYYKYGDLL